MEKRLHINTLATVQTSLKILEILLQKHSLSHWRRFGVFIINFEHISHLCSSVSIVSSEQVNAD